MGELKGRSTPHDTRDQVIDFVRRRNRKTEITVRTVVLWLGLATSKFYSCQARYGRVNEHNAWVLWNFWLEAWEKRALLEFHDRYVLEDYRRLTFMILDANVVAVMSTGTPKNHIGRYCVVRKSREVFSEYF